MFIKSFLLSFCIIFAYLLILQSTDAEQSYLTVPHIQLANKSLYFGIHSRANFVEAAGFCQSHGMRLVTVDNDKLNRAIVDYIRSGPYKNENIWMSGNDIAEEGVFTWLPTGERFRYTNWSKGQPDNFNNNEHCVHYWVDAAHQWNDAGCFQRFYFICEMMPQFHFTKHCEIVN